MRITSELLFKLPVVSETDEHLGRVVGLEIDIDSQSILQYKIAPSSIVERVFKGELLLIHREQVVSITEEKMVVESGAILSRSDQASDKMEMGNLKAQVTPAVNQDAE